MSALSRYQKIQNNPLNYKLLDYSFRWVENAFDGIEETWNGEYRAFEFAPVEACAAREQRAEHVTTGPEGHTLNTRMRIQVHRAPIDQRVI